MEILIIGAGVIGSTYGYHLVQAGHRITFLERGQRLRELAEEGLSVAADSEYPPKTTHRFRLVNSLSPAEMYDYIFVTVRYDHLTHILPLLKNNASKNMLFLVNNPEGSRFYLKELEREKILLGFPGVGGKKEYGIVYYHILSGWLQPTTVGELYGENTYRIQELKKILKRAGFPVTINRDMDAWYQTHLALVCPLANAIYLDGGNNYTLSNNTKVLDLLAKTLKESIGFIRDSPFRINPVKWNCLLYIPDIFLRRLLSWILNTNWAERVISSHSLAAWPEMDQLSQGFLTVANEQAKNLPYFEKLMHNKGFNQKLEKLLWTSSIFFNCLF